jgi:RNA polymerase sigma-70 factor (ECF subfamily)
LETTDAELVARCRSGDRHAWDTIVHHRHARIYNLAYRFTGRADEAEDLTQEVFLKVYRTLHLYRSESGALDTWIVRVARNHFIDHYRKYKIEKTHTTTLEDHFEVATSPTTRIETPAEALDRKEAGDRVHRLLQKLPQDQREAVVLRDLEELTYEEIAELLKVPIGTVKSRINRGRIELARLLRAGAV